MVFSTGCTSAGDRLMTPRISLVAACCSSASSRSRRNRRLSRLPGAPGARPLPRAALRPDRLASFYCHVCAGSRGRFANHVLPRRAGYWINRTESRVVALNNARVPHHSDKGRCAGRGFRAAALSRYGKHRRSQFPPSTGNNAIPTPKRVMSCIVPHSKKNPPRLSWGHERRFRPQRPKSA